METIELKRSLLSTISEIDDNNSVLLEKLTKAVRKIMRQNETARAKETTTPFVDSMKTGIKLPDNLDVKAIRDEHFKEKYS